MEDSEDVDPAGEGIGDGLEDEGCASGAFDLDRRALLRRGRDALDEEVEHGRRAEVLRRDSTGDREELAARDCRLQRGGDLFRRELLPVQVALHQRLVRLDDGVEELGAGLLDLVRHLRGNLAWAPLLRALRARVRGHVQEVDDAGQLVLGSDRQVDGDALRAELRAKLLERSEEVRALAIEHVHEDDAGEPEVFRALPVAGGLHLDAHDAADGDERALDDVQRGDRVALEARLAGRVDEVDLAALPLEVGERVGDRHLALLLVLVPVGDRRPLLDDAQPVRRAGLEEHRLDE